ncbi:MAG TPA: hypothetical protein VK279_04505 [Solirubrobacteraceae bacterium]|nr:hypothetical protein [Solirubrobacteraceae bacterium]
MSAIVPILVAAVACAVVGALILRTGRGEEAGEGRGHDLPRAATAKRAPVRRGREEPLVRRARPEDRPPVRPPPTTVVGTPPEEPVHRIEAVPMAPRSAGAEAHPRPTRRRPPEVAAPRRAAGTRPAPRPAGPPPPTAAAPPPAPAPASAEEAEDPIAAAGRARLEAALEQARGRRTGEPPA